MSLPLRNIDEPHDLFIARCMADPMMVREFPDTGQRRAVCERQAKVRADGVLNLVSEPGAITIEAAADGEPPADGKPKLPKFSMVAYTGGAITGAANAKQAGHAIYLAGGDTGTAGTSVIAGSGLVVRSSTTGGTTPVGSAGISITGALEGDGVSITGGTTGDGVAIASGAISGNGITVNSQLLGHGISIVGAGVSKYGVAIISGASDGINIMASSGNAIKATGTHDVVLAGAGIIEKLSAATYTDLLAAAGNYLLEYRFQPVSGQIIIVRFRLQAI